MPLLALAVGCSKEDIVPAAESVTRFTLRVCPEETQAVTRAADERAVKDMNVFLFDPQGIRRRSTFTCRAAYWSVPFPPAGTMCMP